ncbi:MAG: rRNA pseudouridine synthase [Spirochaetes bacterium]|nr:rRNA pseudouridine synthase [Spirochaetota bacterium]
MKNSRSNNDVRLQKFLSLSGISSRRNSENIINQGRVKVNGVVIFDRSYRVNENDNVEIDNKAIKPQRKIYLVLNKPENYLCTHSDKFGRKTIYDLIKSEDIRIFSLGRLDYKSSGLIILTNDGDFANKVVHPSNNIIKEYNVLADSTINDDLIDHFLKGIKINGITYKALNIERKNKNTVIIRLNEGKKREIREVFKFFKINVKELKRTAIGNLKLDELKIKQGHFKSFSYKEIIEKIL